ncbi:dihydrofolate reductase family protein [Bacteroides rodentium]
MNTKPKVICHIMSSVDGRLLDNRWTKPFDGTEKTELLQVYTAISRELNTDAWMFGKRTVCDIFPGKFNERNTPFLGLNSVFIGERNSKRMFIVSDPDGDILFTSSTLRNDNILVLLGRNVTEEYLAFLRELCISYIVVEDATYLASGLEAANREFGINSVSVQGGGILNGALLKEGIIDELSLVVYPGIDGLAGVSSIFEYIGNDTDSPAKGQSLQLLSTERREHGVIWLRYKFQNSKNKIQ